MDTYKQENEEVELLPSKIPIANSYPDWVLQMIKDNPSVEPEMIKMNYDLLKSFTAEQIADWNKANETDDWTDYDNKYLKDYEKPTFTKQSVFDDVVEVEHYETAEEAERAFCLKHNLPLTETIFID